MSPGAVFFCCDRFSISGMKTVQSKKNCQIKEVLVPKPPILTTTLKTYTIWGCPTSKLLVELQGTKTKTKIKYAMCLAFPSLERKEIMWTCAYVKCSGKLGRMMFASSLCRTQTMWVIPAALKESSWNKVSIITITIIPVHIWLACHHHWRWFILITSSNFHHQCLPPPVSSPVPAISISSPVSGFITSSSHPYLVTSSCHTLFHHQFQVLLPVPPTPISSPVPDIPISKPVSATSISSPVPGSITSFCHPHFITSSRFHHQFLPPPFHHQF